MNIFEYFIGVFEIKPLNFGYITDSVLSAKDVSLFSVRNSGLLSVCSNDMHCGPVTITR